jgi:hypothetical protein
LTIRPSVTMPTIHQRMPLNLLIAVSCCGFAASFGACGASGWRWARRRPVS